MKIFYFHFLFYFIINFYFNFLMKNTKQCATTQYSMPIITFIQKQTFCGAKNSPYNPLIKKKVDS